MDRYQTITKMSKKEMAEKMPCPYVFFSNKGKCIHKGVTPRPCRKCCEDWLSKKV